MPEELDWVAEAAIAKRGEAVALHRLFMQTPVPMVLIGNDLRIHDANPAGQLYLRRPAAHLRGRRASQLLPARQVPRFDEGWAEPLRDGVAHGSIAIRVPDGRVAPLRYAGVANILPGLHLIVGLPADFALVDLVGTSRPSEPAQRGRLRPREKQVLALLARGQTLKEIAQELTLSHSTVRTHLRNAMSRLGARNRTQAFALAVQFGEIAGP